MFKSLCAVYFDFLVKDHATSHALINQKWEVSDSIGPRPVSPTWQLEIRANPKYFLPLLCYAVIVDGRRLCRSSGPHTFVFSVH